MSKTINKIDDELINSIDCGEINIYCSTEDDAKELLNQLYFIGYKWGDDTPINETYFNGTDYDGIIYNIYKYNNTITYWGSNHNYDFEFKLEKNNNSNNMKEVFEFDWDGFKNGEFDVVLKNREEANSFFNAMYDKYNIENRISYDEYFDFIERDDVFIKYNEYEYDKWIWSRELLTDKIVNWSDYMDNNYFNQRDESVDLENIKNNAYKSILKELNKEDELKFSHEEIKDKFFYIDKQVLINCKNIFKSIENETDLSKIDDALNIIDKMIDVKNKLLNDFDI